MSQGMIRYDVALKRLNGDMFSKAEMIVDKGCLSRVGNAWVCKPIPNYNHSTYVLRPLAQPYRVGDYDVWYECDCQGFQMKKAKDPRSAYCSHIMAVEIKKDRDNRLRESIERELRG